MTGLLNSTRKKRDIFKKDKNSFISPIKSSRMNMV